MIFCCFRHATFCVYMCNNCRFYKWREKPQILAPNNFCCIIQSQSGELELQVCTLSPVIRPYDIIAIQTDNLLLAKLRNLRRLKITDERCRLDLDIIFLFQWSVGLYSAWRNPPPVDRFFQTHRTTDAYGFKISVISILDHLIVASEVTSHGAPWLAHAVSC